MRVQRRGNAFTGTSGVPGVLLEARVGVALFFLTSDVGTIRIPDSCPEFFAAQANGLRRQGPGQGEPWEPVLCTGVGGTHAHQSRSWLSPNPHHGSERGILCPLPRWAKRVCPGS